MSPFSGQVAAWLLLEVAPGQPVPNVLAAGKVRTLILVHFRVDILHGTPTIDSFSQNLKKLQLRQTNLESA